MKCSDDSSLDRELRLAVELLRDALAHLTNFNAGVNHPRGPLPSHLVEFRKYDADLEELLEVERAIGGTQGVPGLLEILDRAEVVKDNYRRTGDDEP